VPPPPLTPPEPALMPEPVPLFDIYAVNQPTEIWSNYADG
jgi:hypothetical protein